MKSWSEWSTALKGGVVAGGAGLAALAVGLGVWQPWKQQDPANAADPVGQETLNAPIETTPDATVTVGKEEIPCIVYEGGNWSIYVPTDWTMDAGPQGGTMYPGTEAPGVNGTYITVSQETGSSYQLPYISIAAQDGGTERTFFDGGDGQRWQIVCHTADSDWEETQQMLSALARTFTVDEEKPFEILYPVAAKPDWQELDGKTILWMDKDGYVVSDDADKFVRQQMSEWSGETGSIFTGNYRVDNLSWVGGYTCLPESDYVDVFRGQVWYEVAEGRETDAAAFVGGDGVVENGWALMGRDLDIALYHDGSTVSNVKTAFASTALPGEDAYTAYVLQ